jgi:quaternary ammonium compound-resistance protein SugE
MSIAYAVWTGIGIVGVFIYGLLILKDPISVKNIICVGMILIGIIGLKLGIK